MPEIFHAGSVYTVMASDDFAKSLSDVIAVHNKNNDADLAKANRLIQILGDTGRLRSPDQFRQEGPGFFAIKAGKLRFYGWYEPNQCFVLSHVIFKATQKLDATDVRRMTKNQELYRSHHRGKK